MSIFILNMPYAFDKSFSISAFSSKMNRRLVWQKATRIKQDLPTYDASIYLRTKCIVHGTSIWYWYTLVKIWEFRLKSLVQNVDWRRWRETASKKLQKGAWAWYMVNWSLKKAPFKKYDRVNRNTEEFISMINTVHYHGHLRTISWMALAVDWCQ